MSKDFSTPAFPNSRGQQLEGTAGMTLRDYFAAKALKVVFCATDDGFSSDDDRAKAAYKMADAMLKARDA